MSLKERITEDMKACDARRRQGAARRDSPGAGRDQAARSRRAHQLDDTQVLAVLEKMIKQRRESITQFEAGGRADLVAKECGEICRCCRPTCRRS